MPRAAAIGSLAALLVGLLAVGSWLLRLGPLVNFVSETVLVGFEVGAALVIASTQLPKLFGLAAHGDGFFARQRNPGRGDYSGAHSNGQYPLVHEMDGLAVDGQHADDAALDHPVQIAGPRLPLLCEIDGERPISRFWRSRGGRGSRAGGPGP